MKRVYKFMEILGIVLLLGTIGGIDNDRLTFRSGALIVIACLVCLGWGAFGETIENNRERNKAHKDETWKDVVK